MLLDDTLARGNIAPCLVFTSMMCRVHLSTERLASLTVAIVTAGSLMSPAAQAQSPPPRRSTIQWWHGAVAAGAVMGFMLLDDPVHDFTQDNRSGTLDDVASVFRYGGEREVYVSASVGVLAAGLISSNEQVTRLGARLIASNALTWLTFNAAKNALGRERPFVSGDVGSFHPFTGGANLSLPSGHTAMAFSMATTLADEINRPWATIALYTAATATGWSRINDERHWLSDVFLGAVVGITSSKLVSGRWHIFGIQPPSFLAGPSSGVTLGWSANF